MTQRWSSPMPRVARTTLVAILAAVTVMIAPALPASATNPARDTVSVNGYDFNSERASDVIAGSTDNNLVFRFTAGRKLSDGSLVIQLPAAWSTPLKVVNRMLDDPTNNGGVALRPALPFFPPGPKDCRGAGGAPLTWSVLRAAGRQLIVVRHLDCAPGQSISARVYGVTAPAATGKAAFSVIALDRNGVHQILRPTLTVVTAPTTRLTVTTPPVILIDGAGTIQVRALKASGEVDTAYRGGVSFRTLDNPDCSMDPQEVLLTDFTAADAGVKDIPFVLTSSISHRIRVFDVAHQALPGVSDPYLPAGPANLVTCPTSFH